MTKQRRPPPFAGGIAFELGRYPAGDCRCGTARIFEPRRCRGERGRASSHARSSLLAREPRAAAAVRTPSSRCTSSQRAAGSDLAGIDQSVELVQLSANATNSFDGRDRAADKLAGLQLHHFGAFYKRSSLANDWLWGRLDGATRLVQIVLDPRRLQRTRCRARAHVPAAVADRIVEIATSGANDQEREYLSGSLEARAAACRSWPSSTIPDAEPPPRRLPRCWGAVATGIQWRILHEVACRSLAAVSRSDVVREVPPTARAAPCGRTSLPSERTLTPAETVSAVHEVLRGLGETRRGVRDRLLHSHSSRRRARWTGSLAERRGTFGSPEAGARRLATFVRGVLIALYLLVRGVTSGSRFGMFAVALTLAVGGAFLALTLIAFAAGACDVARGSAGPRPVLHSPLYQGADYLFALATVRPSSR